MMQTKETVHLPLRKSVAAQGRKRKADVSAATAVKFLMNAAIRVQAAAGGRVLEFLKIRRDSGPKSIS
jgi:hypothetical protein